MPSLNKVFLIGRLTADPELRYTQTGLAVSDLRLAVNRAYTAADGSRKEEVCFLDVTVWKRTAETCAEYLHKGSPVFIEGRLQMDAWETPDGQKRSKLRVTATNVQFLEGGRGKAGDEGAVPPAHPEGPDEGADADPPF